jgi:hypothetical protein
MSATDAHEVESVAATSVTGTIAESNMGAMSVMAPPSTTKSLDSAGIAVASALASGEWIEKTDPRGKKFYVNPKTKKRVWSLEKELRASGAKGAPSAARKADTPAEQRETRHARARQRAAAQQELRLQIGQLEQQRIDLEGEVARLQAPVDAEAAHIAELRRQITDRSFSLRVVETEVVEKRQARDVELRAVLNKIKSLQLAVDSDASYKDSVEARHRQLVAEAMDLTADLGKEEAAAETLRQSAATAERRLEEVQHELEVQRGDIARREEQVAAVELQLERTARKRNDVLRATEEAVAERDQLRAKLAKTSRATTATAARASTAVSVDKLAEEYRKKLQVLDSLSAVEAKQDDSMVLEQSTTRVRALVAAAERDAAVLADLRKLLEAEILRVTELVVSCRAECRQTAKRVQAVESAPKPAAD